MAGNENKLNDIIDNVVKNLDDGNVTQDAKTDTEASVADETPVAVSDTKVASVVTEKKSRGVNKRDDKYTDYLERRLEKLSEVLEKQQRMIEELSERTEKKKTEKVVVSEYLYEAALKLDREKKEPVIYKLKRTTTFSGYTYTPTDKNGSNGWFKIVAEKDLNTVTFWFKSEPNKTDLKDGKSACIAMSQIICKSAAKSHQDFSIAEAEMVFKFNAVLGRQHAVIVEL